ncbi:chorismate mutase [uncultured Sphingomonas sp.]|uniref:chorismate mutase n=1 Tax=uncultured Sphingomonas sp. TaxID=158754 RepID=UPI002638468B|nr:chorismate mutase [uncultured Sphingomonas sp.]
MDVSSLDDVRSNIDRLDREIIKLIAERGTYVHQAAKFKTSSADVEAPKRVEQVIAKVRSISEEAGLEPSVAEAAYRAMIAAFVTVEHEAFQRQQTATGV